VRSSHPRGCDAHARHNPVLPHQLRLPVLGAPIFHLLTGRVINAPDHPETIEDEVALGLRLKQEATAEEMWAFAGELMSRFGVNGPLVPYYCD